MKKKKEMGKKITESEFLERIAKTHNNKFDYSMVKYVKREDKIDIICPTHGLFQQTARIHMRGFGCSKCSGLKKMTTKDFILKSNKIHDNKYDYSKTVYKGNGKYLIITCKIHGHFSQKANSHISGNGCHECGGTKKRNTEGFIKKANIIHSNIFDYSLSKYTTAHSKIKIICKKHGEFVQTANSHLKGTGCPTCKYSSGEKTLNNILNENKIHFMTQFKFEKCKNIKELPFDFLLNNSNVCVEFHGTQHFKPIKFFGGENKFNYTIKMDAIKEEFCFDNNVPLIIFWKNYNDSKSMNFVDLFNNCPEKIKSIFLKEKFLEKTNKEYSEFKTSF